MTDIKFMDISENDNPATTDSILVGNNDNGLKRTTLGKLADMCAVHGLLHLQTVSSILQAQTIKYPIQAPAVEGYTFAFWLSTSTIGWMGSTYIDSPTSQQTAIWITYPTGDDLNEAVNGTNHVSATAVYIKNSVA